MLDNLRDDANSSFYEEDTVPPEENILSPAPPKRRSGGKFLGMTPFQRFVIATMLLITVCISGVALLLLTDKIGLVF